MKRILVFAAIGLLTLPTATHAGLLPIGIGAFSGSETVIDYGPTQSSAPVDGVTIGGVLHHFSVGGSPSTDAIIDDGAGNTNNMTVANIEGDSSGILSLRFPALETRMGFGWAVVNLGGGTIELFDASNASLGTLAFSGAPDPTFVGGFAGVQSDLAFARAEVSWDEVGSRFGFDNLRFESVVPEPATIALLVIGLAIIGFGRRKRTHWA